MSATAFGRWEQRFLAADTCPWPGPRPLSTHDGSLLIGRGSDSLDFRNMVDGHRLVILDGKSGIGKTSLLQAKLIPDLRKERYVVAACRDWSDDRTGEAYDFLAEKVRAALREDPAIGDTVSEFRPGAGLFGDMVKDSRKFVIILDQFEELIRYSEERTARILDTLVTLNRNFAINLVVSLRSEYLHELRPLERDVRPFSYSKYELQPVAEDCALELIKAPNTESALCIDDDVAEELAQLWVAARRSDGSEHGEMFGGVGLLHLQALLYALHAQRVTGTESPLSSHDLSVFADSARTARRSVFAHGMIESVDIKLRRCTEACAELADPYLVEGVRSIIARCAPHLSSAGFKLHRETAELAQKSLDDELKNLANGARQLDWRVVLRALISAARPHRDLVRADGGASIGGESSIAAPGAIDLLAHRWTDLTAASLGSETGGQVLIELPTDLASEMLNGATNARSDRKDPSCGPMMALHPAATLVEELRRFAFAIAWMERSSLIRLSTPAPNKMMVSLIHDRFGEGLNAWASTVGDEPAGALFAITAPKGADFYWKRPPEKGVTQYHPLLEGTDGHQVLANLRWKGGWVSADFRNVLFVSCDLRGTMFSACEFRGVAFVNCLLDGSMFDECVIIGGPGPARADWQADPSRFEVPATLPDAMAVVGALATYRGVEGGSTALFAPLPGVAAVPSTLRDHVDPGCELTPWDPPRGGLAIYGGRVSTLIVRACEFRDDDEGPAKLALRFMAGSGFDVVEQQDFGDVEIHGSAVRHVTFTVAHRPSPDDASGAMKIAVSGSSIAQVWIGEGVPGRMTIDNCQVAHVWNSSDDLSVDITRSRFHGLVGCQVSDLEAADGSIAMDGANRPLSIEQVDSSRSFRGRSATMDYTSDPAIAMQTQQSAAEIQAGSEHQENPT